MKHSVFVVIFLVCNIYVHSQQNKSDTTIYFLAEKKPEFEGGESLLFKFILDNLNIETKDCFFTRVFLSFIVEKNGSLSNFNVILKTQNFLDILGNMDKKLCEKKWIDGCMNLLQKMPNWIPGKLNGENVRVKMILPLNLDPQ